MSRYSARRSKEERVTARWWKGAVLEVKGRRRRHGGVLVRAISESRTETATETKKETTVITEEVCHPVNTGEEGKSESLSVMATRAVPLLTLAAIFGVGAHYKDDITASLQWFIQYVEDSGPAGPALFMAIYIVLEVLAVPAIPLTMSAGAIFGSVQGTAMVSVSATTAAALSFLIARYALRDKIKDIANENPKFAAIDNAIGEDSFKVVALLRLSPLLPFALSNYLYGITSVKFRPYVLASWLGMLPGTFAYVSAGAVGMTMVEAGVSGSDAGAGGDWTHAAQMAVGFGFAIVSGGYVARLASEALKDVQDEMDSIEEAVNPR